MSNVHGLHDDRNNDNDNDDNNDENNRFVGGIGEGGGGSGLAVQPNLDDVAGNGGGGLGGGAPGGERDSVFQLAQNASSEDSGQVRRTITMYRDGFMVDDGPYRRLDDPANAEFLRSLAAGRTPRELMQDAANNGGGPGGNSDVVVGLVDKRNEDYVETFRSFQGAGNSLGTAETSAGGDGGTAEDNGVFDPSSLPESPPAPSEPTTRVQVRCLNGQRRVLTVGMQQTVADVAAAVRAEAGPDSFRLVSGFPPQTLKANQTVEEAGLKGAQVSMQKAA